MQTQMINLLIENNDFIYIILPSAKTRKIKQQGSQSPNGFLMISQ